MYDEDDEPIGPHYTETDTPLIRETAKAIAAVYRHNPVGGHLHIVLDDENLDCLGSCREWIKTNENGVSAAQLAAERRCLRLLEQLTEDERYSAVMMYRRGGDRRRSKA